MTVEWVDHMWRAMQKESSDICGQYSSRSDCSNVRFELNCLLIYKLGSHWLTRRQCSSQFRLRISAGWSRAALSAWRGKIPMLSQPTLDVIQVLNSINLNSQQVVHQLFKFYAVCLRLTWGLHCLLICRIGVHWLLNRQCSSQVRLHGSAGWPEASLSTYSRWPLMPL